MPLVPGPETPFGSRFAALNRGAQLAFVAALYEARGWETERTDDAVVVRRNGEERRITVVEPSWFRSTLPDAADTVVVTRDDSGLREAAAEADVHYRTPADLHDALRYGVDSEAAAALVEEHLDCSLSALDTDSSGRWLPRSLPAVPSRSALSASTTQKRLAVVAALLLLAAVFVGPEVAPAFGESSEPPAPEWNGSNATGTVGAIGAEQTYPEGLSEDGIENSGVLAEAHAEHLANRSYSYRLNASGPQHATFMFGLSSWNATVRIENRTSYRYRKNSVAPYGFRVSTVETIDGDNETRWDPIREGDPDAEAEPEVLTKQVYADGTTKYWRFGGPEQVDYRRASVDQEGNRIFYINDRVAGVLVYIRWLLWTENSSVDCVSRAATGECEAFRAVATGEPVELRGEVREYRATAVVEDSGLVRSLTVRYTVPTLEDPDEYVEVRFRLQYVNVGNETGPLKAPPWVDAAENETTAAGNETASG